MTDIEQQLLDEHNKLRAKHGVPALRWSYTLGAAALSHSEYMAKVGQLAHQGIGDGTPTSRVVKAGYKGFGGWENAAMGYKDVPAVMVGWMSDAGHMANVLNKKVDEIGSNGVNGSKGMYWTADFGQSNGNPPEPDPSPHPAPPGPPPTPPAPPAPLPFPDDDFMLIGQKYHVNYNDDATSYNCMPVGMSDDESLPE